MLSIPRATGRGFVYILCDGDVPRYVGTTDVGPKQRLKGHINAALNGARYQVSQWFAAMLERGEMPIMLVVYEGPCPNDIERCLIDKLIERECDLLNLKREFVT